MAEKIKTWGREIWDKKQSEQGSLGVIAGAVETRSVMDNQTRIEFRVIDKFVTPLLKKGARIIDMGIGPFARFSIGFARRGFLVTGVDISPEVLKTARNEVAKSGQKVILVEDDLADIKKIKEKQDLVFCFGTFGHIPSFMSIKVLSGFNKLLKKDGYAYVHFWINKKKTARKIVKDFVYEMGHYVKSRFGKGYKVNSSFYTEDEIKEMAKMSGFEIITANDGAYLLKKVREVKN